MLSFSKSLALAAIASTIIFSGYVALSTGEADVNVFVGGEGRSRWSKRLGTRACVEVNTKTRGMYNNRNQ